MKTSLMTILFLFGLLPLKYMGTNESDHPTVNSKYPTPQITGKLLFYVQRTHNMNTVIYELNFKTDGKLDKKEPLHALWIRYEEGGVRKELTFIQNRVYGLDVHMLENETYLIHFKSMKQRAIYLMQIGKDNQYKAMISINGKMAELTSLFICSVTNSLGIPSSVEYININGIDHITGNIVNERVIP